LRTKYKGNFTLPDRRVFTKTGPKIPNTLSLDLEHATKFDLIRGHIAYIWIWKDAEYVSYRLEVQVVELASKVSVLRQRSLVPFLRVAPLLLELGNNVLVGVGVQLGMRKKHTEDGAPSAVESTSNPTNCVDGYMSGRRITKGREETYPWKVLVASPAKWKRCFFEAG